MSAAPITRIGVTGGDGFLGRHVIAALRTAGVDVVTFSRRAAATDGVIACDLLDSGSRKAALRQAQCSHLVHLAWRSDPRARLSSPDNIDWACASALLAREFAEAGGKRFIFGGSSAQYRWGGGRLDEFCDLDAATLYGAAKSAAEALLVAAAPTLGISVASARIFFCYGPGEPSGRLVPDVIAALRAGAPAPCTDGLQKRDYLYAGDVGAALALIARSDVEGPINVCSGRAIEVRSLIAEIARQMGRPDLPHYGAVARPKDDPPIVEGDPARLAALGFTPRYNLAEGVALTLDHFQRSSSR